MVPLLVLVCALLMGAVEWLRPGRRWPSVRGWWLRASLLSGAQAGVIYLAGLSWDGWLADYHPWHPPALGPVAGALLGYVAITFVFYFWHRARHEVPWLWRWVHQVHHSPQRLEVITSFYKHPLEMVLNSVLTAIIVYPLCGLSPLAATGALALCGLAELFYHWNVQTPRWLGWFVQRPEMHCEHHRAGVHRHNYADLPIWDALFGTLHNPARFEGRCGFGDDEHRLAEMAVGRQVTQ